MATAFLVVGCEGLETALFVRSAVQATGDGARPLVGVILGLLTSVALGWLFYRGALRINFANRSGDNEPRGGAADRAATVIAQRACP